ncbi:bis(5'-adenosyl)-triphosphatase-like [Montipora capricornis]|uniref:bis(5'-adenosyl)-triphosphatase-like n=1 Tax=Montipora capricornis TaxID=246305 RepID=UPI0035F1E866
MASRGFNFGRIILEPSVIFFRSKLSFAFVNIKPVLPGHVLVSPVRIVERFCELTEEEVADLFTSTQKIARVIEKAYDATSLSIAIQDGPDAGQTVEHVHVHVLPRKRGDFKQNDDIYKALEEHDKQKEGLESKAFRTNEEMEKEASYLAGLF